MEKHFGNAVQAASEVNMNEVMNYYMNSIEQAKNEVKRLEDLEQKFTDLSKTFEKIKDIVRLSFVSGTEKIFVTPKDGSPRDKKTFSYSVERITEALGEYPCVSVQPGEYIAEWEDNKVHLYCMNAVDCKTIENREMKEVVTIKPHPSCIAALKELEH